MKPHRASTVLVLGILSLVVCAPLGIIAWIMGNADLREMNAGYMDPTGRDSTSAGRICGIIGTVLFALTLVMLVLWFAFVGTAVAVGLKEAQQQRLHPVPAQVSPN